MQAPIGGGGWGNRRELLCLFGEGVGFGSSSVFPPFVGLRHQRNVPPVLLASLAAGVGWDECSCKICVQCIQGQITADGAYDRALWRTTQRGVRVPVLQRSCLEPGLDQP